MALARGSAVRLRPAGGHGPVFARPAVPDGTPTSGPVDFQGAPLATIGAHPADQAGLAAAYGHLPLSFEANQGQADPAVDFLAHGQGYTLALSGGEAVLALRQPSDASGDAQPPAPEAPSTLRLQLRGAAAAPEVVGLDPLPGTANYFLGIDPAAWHTGIPTYARVQYRQVYPGIDVVYYGSQGQFEDDFVVGPGADPSAIHLAFVGAERVQLNDVGDLVVQVAGGQVRQATPVIYQERPQGRQAVAGSYVLAEDGDVAFAVGAYDPTQPLVIDPVLVYSTFLGGCSSDFGSGIAVDVAGNAYVTGHTGSADFPTTPGAFQPTFHDLGDVFVSKLNSMGTVGGRTK